MERRSEPGPAPASVAAPPGAERAAAAAREPAREPGLLRTASSLAVPATSPGEVQPLAAPAASVEAEPAPAPPPGPEVNRPPARPDRRAPEPAPGPPPQVSEHSAAVYPDDFPDPYVLPANGSFWAFSTQVGLTAVPTLRSNDLVSWEWVGDALQGTPPWADWGSHWAPAVLQRGSTFVLYYTTRDRASGLQCISRAVSVLPQGPYLDRSAGPLICQTRRGGSIDPSPFVDADGRAWLLWKSEGTVHGEPTRLWVRPLSADGQRLEGEPVELLRRALPWEFPIIENPAMVLVDGRHHLFYSGNRWESPDYAVGHAVCDSVVGPCRRTSPGPVLSSRPGASGPGGQELLQLFGGRHLLVHHAWDPAHVGYPHGARMLHVAELGFDGDHVTVGRPWRPSDDLLGGLAPGPARGTAVSSVPAGLAGMPH